MSRKKVSKRKPELKVKEIQNKHGTNNTVLSNARASKKDEFYTQLSDIEKEMKYYKKHFKGKTILCNCGDSETSNFFHYFSHNFEELELKKLITISYRNRQSNLFGNKSEKSIYLEYDGENKIQKYLKSDGDFRNDEGIEILKYVDIVVTNPPYSLFREYVSQLVQYNKKFIIMGNINAVSYKEIFPLIKDNKMGLGSSIHSGDREFEIPSNYTQSSPSIRIDELGKMFVRVTGIRWFTNIDYQTRYEDLVLTKKYTPEEYPKYDNYNAINVDKTKDIPMDYEGVMGVPITFMDKYNPEQFEILGCDYNVKQGLLPKLVNASWDGKMDRGYIKDKRLYSRIFIKHKRKN